MASYRVLDPDDADQGPPYVVVEPDHCIHCDRAIRLSLNRLPRREPWTYLCFCGFRIECTPVVEVM